MIVIMLDCDSIVKGTVLVIVLVIVRVLLLVIIVNVLSGGVAWVWTARQRSPAAWKAPSGTRGWSQMRATTRSVRKVQIVQDLEQRLKSAW